MVRRPARAGPEPESVISSDHSAGSLGSRATISTGIRQVARGGSDQLRARPRAGPRRRCPPPRRRSPAPGCRPGVPEPLQARAVDRRELLGIPLRRAQQAEDDGDVADQLEQRSGPVGVGERRLDPGRLDRRQALLAAAGPAHRPALREQPLSQLPAAAAAADDQRPRHAATSTRRDRGRAAAGARPRRPSRCSSASSSPGRRGGGASRSAPRASGARRRSRSAPRPRASGSASSRPGRRWCPGRSDRRATQHADHEGEQLPKVPRTNSTRQGYGSPRCQRPT